METVSHTLFNCKFLLLTCDTISKCLETPVHNVAQDHEKTLSTPHGLLLWFARQASCNVRNSVRLSHRLVNVSHLLTIWHSILQSWADLPCLSVNRGEVRKFMTVLHSFLITGGWLYTAVSRTRPSSSPQQKKAHCRELRKLEHAERVRELLNSLHQEGRETIWRNNMDRRIVRQASDGGLLGRGIWSVFSFETGINVSEFCQWVNYKQ